jgi:CO/xanthine dehydrogenase Mo-binding subunit
MTGLLGLAEHKLRVIAPDVGGGFGSKIYLYAEETVLTWAAKQLNRPIKWTAERSESFLSDAHGRDHVTKAELALDKEREIPRDARRDHREHGRLPLHRSPPASRPSSTPPFSRGSTPRP